MATVNKQMSIGQVLSLDRTTAQYLYELWHALPWLPARDRRIP